MKNCEKNFYCQRCSTNFPLKMKKMHKKRCKKAENQVYCASCKKKVVNVVSHQRHCHLKKKEKCKNCNQMISSKTINHHLKKCLDKKATMLNLEFLKKIQSFICKKCGSYANTIEGQSRHSCSQAKTYLHFGSCPKYNFPDIEMLENEYFIPQTKKNNFREFFEKNKLKSQFKMTYDTCVPNQIFYQQRMLIENKQMTEIYRNYEVIANKLPLMIYDTYKQKGFGLKATQKIKKNSFIGFYHGHVTCQSKMPYIDSDVFTLAVIKRDNEDLDHLIVLSLQKNYCYTKFINCNDADEDVNCEAVIVTIKIENCYQVLLAIFSCEDIEKGQEILMTYGSGYWDDEKNEKKQIQLNGKIIGKKRKWISTE